MTTVLSSKRYSGLHHKAIDRVSFSRKFLGGGGLAPWMVSTVERQKIDYNSTAQQLGDNLHCAT